MFGHMKNIIAAAALICTAATVSAQGEYSQIAALRNANRGISGLRSTADGLHYTFRNGQGIAMRGYDGRPDEQLLLKVPFGYVDYAFSPDERYILTAAAEGSRPIYRHSYTADYYIAEVGGTPRRILEDARDVSFSPDGRTLAFARGNVRCRGISTAAAMAATAAMEGDRILALFDGRRDELLAFGLRREETFYRPDGVHAVLGNTTLELLDKYDAFVCLSRDEAQIRKVAGSAVEGKLHPLEHLKASSLIFTSPGDFSTTLKDLVYLRPAVFVEPRIPRTL